jgi:hypothetical protein
MKKRNLVVHALLASAASTLLMASGCSSSVSDGGLPPAKPATEEEIKASNEKVNAARGGYKGAPGMPPPKR